MKSALNFILVAILNVLLFALMQIAAVFVHFFIYGEGAVGDSYGHRVSTFFVLLQLIILLALFLKKAVIKTNTVLIVNILIVVGLYICYRLLPEILSN